MTRKTRNLLTINQKTLIYIFSNFKRTIKADHILELAGIGLFCYYRFINRICKIRLRGRLTNYKLISGLSDYDCTFRVKYVT